MKKFQFQSVKDALEKKDFLIAVKPEASILKYGEESLPGDKFVLKVQRDVDEFETICFIGEVGFEYVAKNMLCLVFYSIKDEKFEINLTFGQAFLLCFEGVVLFFRGEVYSSKICGGEHGRGRLTIKL